VLRGRGEFRFGIRNRGIILLRLGSFQTAVVYNVARILNVQMRTGSVVGVAFSRRRKPFGRRVRHRLRQQLLQLRELDATGCARRGLLSMATIYAREVSRIYVTVRKWIISCVADWRSLERAGVRLRMN